MKSWKQNFLLTERVWLSIGTTVPQTRINISIYTKHRWVSITQKNWSGARYFTLHWKKEHLAGSLDFHQIRWIALKPCYPNPALDLILVDHMIWHPSHLSTYNKRRANHLENSLRDSTNYLKTLGTSAQKWSCIIWSLHFGQALLLIVYVKHQQKLRRTEVEWYNPISQADDQGHKMHFKFWSVISAYKTRSYQIGT